MLSPYNLVLASVRGIYRLELLSNWNGSWFLIFLILISVDTFNGSVDHNRWFLGRRLNRGCW